MASQSEMQRQDSVTQQSDNISAKELTKQMLLNCKVLRKRNTNVSTTYSQNSKVRGSSQAVNFMTLNPPQTNTCLEEVAFSNKNAYSIEKLNLTQVIRTAGTGKRPSNDKYEEVGNNRASTCENVGHRTQRFGMRKNLRPLNPLPPKQLMKPR